MVAFGRIAVDLRLLAVPFGRKAVKDALHQRRSLGPFDIGRQHGQKVPAVLFGGAFISPPG